MLTIDQIRGAIPYILTETNLSGLGQRGRGKVRDFYRVDGKRVLVTTDRLSAFDRVVGHIPFKGQVLNQLAAFWFKHTSDILPNHLISVPDPNVSVVRECEALPVEIVVRGYISGSTSTSLWTRYAAGERTIYGLSFPGGLRKNEKLREPVITPTTRGTGPGGHDERITREEIIERGLVPEDLYAEIEEKALVLFARGTEICAKAGIILVDTKYEFGLLDGQLTLIDEIHTPDSSRFWLAQSYEERFEAGREPENFDKEFIRLWFGQQGYRGDDEPPTLPEEVVVQASQRYQRVYERITGRDFEPGVFPIEGRIDANLRRAGWIH
ncbi:MAG: phosphoribosylaminoimidazolesuccinocarboxamide synthase [Chloroflexota bacterium]|nr:phosphoribosylaminoimidazolesuccinocarboxamide synthase [Chloroflexota bacterium]